MKILSFRSRNSGRRTASALLTVSALLGIAGTSLANPPAPVQQQVVGQQSRTYINDEPQEEVQAGFTFYSACRMSSTGEYPVMIYNLRGKHLYTNCFYSHSSITENGAHFPRHFFAAGRGFQITVAPRKYMNSYGQEYTEMDFLSLR